MTMRFTTPIVTIPDPDTSPHPNCPIDEGTGLPPEATTLLEYLGTWDAASARHCRRVSSAACELGRWVGLPSHSMKRLRLAAFLHDIGKLETPPAILQKPGRLSDAEYTEIKAHAAAGSRILAAEPAFAGIIGIVHAHHERWDGTGYPEGLAGIEIPIESRVIAVVDTWDAITAMRPYERRRPEFLSLAEIRRCAGSQFDPDIAAAFIDMTFERLQSARRCA
ncbi:MAG: HD domain-containing phosphohydrolase [Phycisphaerales bacterium]|nr:HD domain-containing phosphohydrolase [Phycisphaerales bacterium]